MLATCPNLACSPKKRQDKKPSESEQNDRTAIVDELPAAQEDGAEDKNSDAQPPVVIVEGAEEQAETPPQERDPEEGENGNNGRVY